MKLFITMLCTLLICGCITTGSSYTPPEKHRIYDKNGSYSGEIHDYKYESRIYDKKGSYIGKIRTNKYGSRVYDKKGNLLYKIK